MDQEIKGIDDNEEFLSPQFIRKRAFLSREELENVLSRVNDILEKEPKLVTISDKSRLYFLGDTHGNLTMTLHALKHLFPDKNGVHTKFDRIIFLGDFIDRGLYSVENINLLMSLKAEYPDRIILIRGNHESREINIRFEFYEMVIRRYGMVIFEKYNKVFAKLPLAVLTWNKIFAVHGGIPENLEKLSDLNGLDDEVDPESRITFQLLWNDPVEKDGWFFRNFRGKYSKKFGRDAFEYFIKKHDIKLILRAHEVQKKGYKNYFGAKLVSIDSTKKRKKEAIKVFIVEKDGSYKVSEVEEYVELNLRKLFYGK
ncbi:MAG: metallophosphoesterase [Promethearchaeota archaeon]